MTSEKKSIRIRQVRSAIGTKPKHREILRGLGLRRSRTPGTPRWRAGCRPGRG